MPLWNAESFLGNLRTFRVCWLGGRYGGGKTALAFRLAYELVKSGFSRYVLTNVQSPWADKPSDVQVRAGQYIDSVIIADEGGLFLKTKRDTEEFIAFNRKFNTVVLVPSVIKPSNVITGLTVRRTVNLQPAGIPLWVFEMRLVSDKVYKEHFYWWKPQEIFGLYATEDIPVDDDEIGLFLTEHLEKVKKSSGKSKKRAAIASRRSPSMDGFGGFVESFQEAADQLEGTISILSEQNGRGNRKRRR